MPDHLSAAARSENMRRIKSSSTAPELLVRRMVYAMGYRFRLHRKDLPGKPDIVLGSRRKIIFVHGCFWHQHDACRAGRLPKSNSSYWTPKLQRNIERDQAAQQALQAAGWDVLVVWDCETKISDELVRRLRRFLEKS